jgi:opacity protein-like surface antigen
MKKLLAVLVTVLIFSSASFGQKYQLGVHFGSGFAQLSNLNTIKDDVWGANRKFSAKTGINLTMKFKSRLYFDAEINATNKGNIRNKTTSENLYLSFSPSLKLNLGKPERLLQPYLSAGAYASRLVNHKIRYTTGVNVSKIGLLESFDPPKSDYGLNFGIGANYKFTKNMHLGFEIKMERGLKDVLGPPYEFIIEKPKAQNIAAWGVLCLKRDF